MAAHSSPLVRFLLMDDKGGEERRIKAYLVCVCVCAESRCDVCLEIILYHLALIMYGTLDVWTSWYGWFGRKHDAWMCMDMFGHYCFIL